VLQLKVSAIRSIIAGYQQSIPPLPGVKSTHTLRAASRPFPSSMQTRIRLPGGGIVSIARSIWDWFFGCRHKQLSRAFTNEGETYKVCLKCGKRFPYSLETMTIVSARAQRKAAARRVQRKSFTK
jgi:hypothetical protein